MTRDRSSDAARRSGPIMTRRAVLQSAGTVIATALCRPVRATAAASPIGPVMDRLSTYMSAAPARPLPAEVVVKAQHHVLDTVAAMVSGTELPPGACRAWLRAHVRREGGNDCRFEAAGRSY